VLKESHNALEALIARLDVIGKMKICNGGRAETGIGVCLAI
jgi:hypothetical protein